MGLRIGIDLVNLSGFIGGMGRLASQLLEALSSYDRKNEYFLFMNEGAARELNLPKNQFHINISTAFKNRYIPRNQLHFALQSYLLPRLDILHSPVSVSPLLSFRPLKTMVTITDLAHITNPESSPRLTRLWRDTANPICFRKASHIVAISESTKKDIMEHYHISGKKISVIYLFVSLRSRTLPQEEAQRLKKLYGIPDKYILHVGYSHRRKNQMRLIEAYLLLKRKIALPHKLFLVGPGGWERVQYEQFIRENHYEKDVIFPGFIPDEHMPLVYSGADVFIFPSLYEGFGYPPLEAMACGTPVIVSDRPSLPEVVGDAALFVDPLSPQDMSDKMESVITSPEIAERLRSKGRERVRFFSLEKMAKEYINTYHRIVHDD